MEPYTNIQKEFKPNVQLPSSDTQTVTSAIPLTTSLPYTPPRLQDALSWNIKSSNFVTSFQYK
jgi:hypothetical protein